MENQTRKLQKFGPRISPRKINLSEETSQYLSDWAAHIGFNKKSEGVLIESALRTLMGKKNYQPLHKSFTVLKPL